MNAAMLSPRWAYGQQVRVWRRSKTASRKSPPRHLLRHDRPAAKGRCCVTEADRCRDPGGVRDCRSSARPVHKAPATDTSCQFVKRVLVPIATDLSIKRSMQVLRPAEIMRPLHDPAPRPGEIEPDRTRVVCIALVHAFGAPVLGPLTPFFEDIRADGRPEGRLRRPDPVAASPTMTASRGFSRARVSTSWACAEIMAGVAVAVNSSNHAFRRSSAFGSGEVPARAGLQSSTA